jgi:hypothetical protein
MPENARIQEELTNKQEQLITLLLSGIGIGAACHQCGINEKTAFRWRKLPHFQQAYRNAQRVLFDDALLVLVLGVHKAIETLERNLNGADVPPSVQVNSARIWLENAIGVHKLTELEAQLAELKDIVSKQQGAGHARY